MKIFSGWLFDIYPNETGLTVWMIGEDGKRRRFVQDFTATVYAAGPSARLRSLWRWLQRQPVPVRLGRTERLDVFFGMTVVLSIEILQPGKLDELFRNMVTAYADLTFYDGDISLALRYAAAYGVFPLARCEVEVADVPEAPDGRVVRITALDTPWDLEPAPAPLRIMSLEPDCDPAHGEPKEIIVSYERV